MLTEKGGFYNCFTPSQSSSKKSSKSSDSTWKPDDYTLLTRKVRQAMNLTNPNAIPPFKRQLAEGLILAVNGIEDQVKKNELDRADACKKLQNILNAWD